jgi:exonuclease III
MSIKIASWNLCLGLQNKKDYVDYKLNEESIDICGLQECEIPPSLDDNNLTLKNYKVELEDNQRKKRTGFLIKNNINYERKRNLEEQNTNLVIIDLNGEINYRVINIYRSFAPERNATPTENFLN